MRLHQTIINIRHTFSELMDNTNHSTVTPKVPGNRIGLKNFSRWRRNILMTWLRKNRDNPYPCEFSKNRLGEECGLTNVQIWNWFTNARKRLVFLQLKQISGWAKSSLRQNDWRWTFSSASYYFWHLSYSVAVTKD